MNMFISKEEWLDKNKRKSDMENSLLERTYTTLMGNVYDKDGYRWSPYRCITPGKGSFTGIWNWDTAFHSIGVSRWDTDLAKDGILGFTQFQDEKGKFPDIIWENGNIEGHYAKPPLFSKACEIVYRRDGDREFLKKMYPRLVANENHWRENRCHSGMFFYDSEDKGEEIYQLHVRYESGWDNSVRWDKTITDMWPIDLNCFAVMDYRSLTYIANVLNLCDDAKMWAEKGDELADLINERLWDGKNGYYADANKLTGEISDVLTPASFMPLYINIASKEQALSMAEIAEKSFGCKMPTVAFDNPNFSTDYWRGPTWLNVAYFAARGLKNYGLDVADMIRDNIIKMCFDEKRGIFENYNSLTGEGLCCDHFSWSCVFLNEFILNWGEKEIW